MKLPPDFMYEPENPELSNYVTFRAKIDTPKECRVWVEEFGRLTFTKWIVIKTKNETRQIICRKEYACHHSMYRKKLKKTGKSKNLNCKATIRIVIMKTKRYCFPARITINNNHSHAIDDVDVLSSLPASMDTRIQFEDHFNNGMGIVAARNFHRNKIKMLHDTDLANTALNPKYRTVRFWYDTWRKSGSSPSTGIRVFKKLKEKLKKKKAKEEKRKKKEEERKEKERKKAVVPAIDDAAVSSTSVNLQRFVPICPATKMVLLQIVNTPQYIAVPVMWNSSTKTVDTSTCWNTLIIPACSNQISNECSNVKQENIKDNNNDNNMLASELKIEHCIIKSEPIEYSINFKSEPFDCTDNFKSESLDCSDNSESDPVDYSDNFESEPFEYSGNFKSDPLDYSDDFESEPKDETVIEGHIEPNS